VTTPHIPVQFWILLVIGSIALAPATYIYRYRTHSPSRQEIGKPPEDLSWRSPETYSLCLLALIALAGLAIFIFTPTAADFARSWIFAPAVLAGLAILATYQVIRGLRTGAEEPMIRGFYTSYNRSTQPKRYWASIMWNSALGLMMGAGAIAALWAGAANAGQDECFNTKGDYSPKDALTACNRLIQKHPSNDSRLPDTLMARGNAYYELRDWEHAISDYSQSLQLRPDQADLLENRGMAYQQTGLGEEAIADFSHALRLHPKAEIYFRRADAYERALRDPRRAIQDLTAAIRLTPDYEDAFYDRGYCYGQIGNYQLAIADFSAAIRLNPNSADAYYYRGVAYQKMGNSDQAAADRTTALHLDPHLLDRRRAAPTATTS